MIKTAVILAGGFGTRLRSEIRDLPKPLAPVRNRPFMSYLLQKLAAYHIRNIVISTGYMSEKIKEEYGTAFNGLNIRYSHEETPLGTGGASRQALLDCDDENVLVTNGDSLFDFDLSRLVSYHKQQQASCTIALRKVEDSSRYGCIELDQNNNIVRFREKTNIAEPGLINSGVYAINRKTFLENTPAGINFSIEKDFFEKQAGTGRLKGLVFGGYFIDIGIPEDLKRAQDEFERFEN